MSDSEAKGMEVEKRVGFDPKPPAPSTSVARQILSNCVLSKNADVTQGFWWKNLGLFSLGDFDLMMVPDSFTMSAEDRDRGACILHVYHRNYNGVSSKIYTLDEAEEVIHEALGDTYLKMTKKGYNHFGLFRQVPQMNLQKQEEPIFKKVDLRTDSHIMNPTSKQWWGHFNLPALDGHHASSTILVVEACPTEYALKKAGDPYMD